jgi:hypothetical protein
MMLEHSRQAAIEQAQALDQQMKTLADLSKSVLHTAHTTAGGSAHRSLPLPVKYHFTGYDMRNIALSRRAKYRQMGMAKNSG